ncbi:MAG: Ig-like domain repeat protein [Acidimicrobiales bacterium]
MSRKPATKGRGLGVRGWVVVLSASLATFGVGIGLAASDNAAGANPVPTSTILTSSVNPSVSGQQVTFAATVAEVPPGPTPSGSVRFTIAGFPNPCQGDTDTEPLSAGSAQCVTSALLAQGGTVSVTATYLGDAGDDPSSSGPLPQQVTQAAPAVAVTSTAVHSPITESGCSLTSGSTAVTSCSTLQGVTAGASVTDSGSAIPAGTTVASLNHDGNTLALSAPASATVTEPLTFVDNPADTYPSGHPARFTATVTAASPGSGTPTGLLTWTITSHLGSSVFCTNGTSVKISRAGTATCVVPQGQLVSGGAPYTVEAAYGGDQNFSAGSQSSSQPIMPSTSKTYLAGSPLPPVRSTGVHFTASVVPSAFGAVPTGTVTFSFTSAPFNLTSCTVSSGSTRVACAGGIANVLVGEQLSDTTTPGAIPAGTTVSAVGTNNITMSAAATAPSGGRGDTVLVTPTTTPTVSCAGVSNTVELTSSGATCDLPGGLPFVGSPFALVASYSGDANDGASSSHALTIKVR